MKKIIRVLVSLMVSTTLLIGMSLSVFGAEQEYKEGDVVDCSLLLRDEYTESISNSLTRGNFLNRGVASLTDNNNGTINVYGAVYAGVVCDKLILEMTLQRLQGGSWVTVKNYSDTSYNSSVLTKSYNPSVSGGYYYRVKAACVAFEGETSESQMPVTNGIWID